MIASTIQNIHGTTDRTQASSAFSEEHESVTNSTQDDLKLLEKLMKPKEPIPMYGKKRRLYFKNKYK